MTLVLGHLAHALTEARQQVAHRFYQAQQLGGHGAVGVLRAAIMAQEALRLCSEYPNAAQLLLRRTEDILTTYAKDARTAREAFAGTEGSPHPRER